MTPDLTAAARRALEGRGLITVTDGTVTLTDLGRRALDEMGER